MRKYLSQHGNQRRHPTPLLCLALVMLTCHSLRADEVPSADEVSFSRDIQPLLANTCYTCHGPDEGTREADLRLDSRETVVASGDGVVIPGDPENSELLRRVLSEDPDERMPPASSKKALTEEQIEMLRQWIAAGAPWEGHWAFQSIQKPELPATKDSRHPIDVFISDRLSTAKLEPVAAAKRDELIRRLYIDLLGILPSPEAVDSFVADTSPNAVEKLVDELLSSPHYGERWGRYWLDQARYADSDGYSIDGARVMWPYRDWVINAINQDIPFDQFTIEQLAGDLMADPSVDQLVATGFHRNTLVNQEGGSDPEQFRNETVVDRVNTTGAVWLGLTVGCAQCHTHKFDPITQVEYYQLFAFFNSTEDKNSHNPQINPLPAKAQKSRDEIAAAIKSTREALPEGDSTENESLRKSLESVIKQLEEAQRGIEGRFGRVMVMRELGEPRTTHLLIRGDFLRKGEEVTANVPQVLPPLPANDGSHSRLDLARWLVDRSNPLTARVIVNRTWMRFFGQGLVETENDFGTQGSLPTHPELLDWLAHWLIEQEWSIKRLHRYIVLSDTYQRSSRATSELVANDPRNQLLGRQSRIRVDAELVRDLALSASGTLTSTIGGPSVYPPQPDGVYAFTQRRLSWETSQGADRYRRGMYTFFYRSAPHPMLTTFDAPNFQTVCTRRVRSNTPLQALTMANDEAIIEMAEGLARRLILHGPSSDEDRITMAFRLCLSRHPDAAESQQLQSFIALQRDRLTDTDTSPTDQEPADIELATWTALARVLMNLDEFLTRG